MLFQSVEAKVMKAKDSPELQSKLIEGHLGFIRKCIAEHIKASGVSVDEEMTVAMLAFQEAVETYEASRGKFYSFCKIVIGRRLIDDFRKKIRHEQGVVSLDVSACDDEGAERPNDALVNVSMKAYEQLCDKTDLQYEIMAYAEILTAYGLSFNDLIESSPKQETLRKLYMDTSHWLVSQPHLFEELKTTRKLPITKIVQAYDIDKKRLERGRRYIIAVAVLLDSDFEKIKAYVRR